MRLLHAIGLGHADEFDSTRPFRLGNLQLGLEAAAEADRILGGGEFVDEVVVEERDFQVPVYWQVAHKAEGGAELFGFPADHGGKLPTAIEVALVRAIAATPEDQHSTILQGGVEVALGPERAWAAFRTISSAVNRPMVGDSALFDQATQAIVDERIDDLLTPVARNCLINSFRTTPIKFRFLELYRVMEARFLADVKMALDKSFEVEPGVALAEAVEALKTEMNQIIGLAKGQQDAFEACWTALHDIKNTNRFAAALFRRVAQKDAVHGPKWQTGAALIYQTRCAIVHAGKKDMIFENYGDGDDALNELLPFVERASLLLLGIELS